MKLLLHYLYFLMFTFLATTCMERKLIPNIEGNQVNKKKDSCKNGKESSEKDLDFNEIDDGNIPAIFESDPKKGQIKPEDVNKVNSTGYTPLLKAVMKNDLVKAKELLLLGADPNIARGESTPIGWAVHNKNKDIVALLLSHGAEVIFRKDGESDILVSLELDNDQETLDIILCHFARKGKKDSVGLSPIHWACRDGHLNVVKHILVKDPSLVHNSDNLYKFTPLHWAARRGFKEIVELLTSKGANKTATSKSGFTPLMLAISNKHEGLREILSPDGFSRHLKLVDKAWQCSICIEGVQDSRDKIFPVIQLDCGHKFHFRCITMHVLNQYNHHQAVNCPYCRGNLSKDIVEEIVSHATNPTMSAFSTLNAVRKRDMPRCIY